MPGTAFKQAHIRHALMSEIKKAGGKPIKKQVSELKSTVSRMKQTSNFVLIKQQTGANIPMLGALNPATDITTLGLTMIAVCGNSAGNGVWPLNNTRDSNKVRSQYLDLRYTIDRQTADSVANEGFGSLQCRVFVIRCKGLGGGSINNLGATPPPMGSILAPLAVGAYTNTDIFNQKAERANDPVNRSIDVLYERLHNITIPDTLVGSCDRGYVTVHKRIKAKHLVCYSGTTAAETSVIDGQMFVVAVSNATNNTHPLFFEGSIAWHYNGA